MRIAHRTERAFEIGEELLGLVARESERATMRVHFDPFCRRARRVDGNRRITSIDTSELLATHLALVVVDDAVVPLSYADARAAVGR